MKCPYCGYDESKVIDSRPTDEGERIRRRRECLKCTKRFTTYEIIETVPVVVVKKDRDVEAFPQEDRAGLAARYVAEYNAANGIVVEPKVVKVEEPAEEADEKENE
jgi:transcriptional regulator NrdR family protein